MFDPCPILTRAKNSQRGEEGCSAMFLCSLVAAQGIWGKQGSCSRCFVVSLLFPSDPSGDAYRTKKQSIFYFVWGLGLFSLSSTPEGLALEGLPGLLFHQCVIGHEVTEGAVDLLEEVL